MPVEIRSYSDLVRETRRAVARHEVMRKQRLAEISRSIERAVRLGASEVRAIIEALSERERADLVRHFPQFLTTLRSAPSLDHVLTITRGTRALFRSTPDQGAKPRLDPSSAGLARRAFAFANAPVSARSRVLENLERVDSNSDSLMKLFLIWLPVKYSFLKKNIRRFLRRIP